MELNRHHYVRGKTDLNELIILTIDSGIWALSMSYVCTSCADTFYTNLQWIKASYSLKTDFCFLERWRFTILKASLPHKPYNWHACCVCHILRLHSNALWSPHLRWSSSRWCRLHDGRSLYLYYILHPNSCAASWRSRICPWTFYPGETGV